MPKWKRGRYYHGYVRVGGVTSEQRTTGCTDPTAAEAVLRGWERELADPAYAASKGRRLKEAVAGLLKGYEALSSRGKRAVPTLDYYREKCGTLIRIIGGEGLLVAINAPLIDSYIEARREEDASEHTISKELKTLKLVLKYAKRQGWYSGDFDAVFPAFSAEYDPRDRYLIEDELFAMCTAIPSPDAAAQLAFAVATSAELKAVQSAQRTDVAEGGEYVLIRGTKRELRWRTVPIVTGLQKRLLAFALKHAKGQGVLLFRGAAALPNALRRTSARLGMAHVSANDLRRTFAVHMREEGFPLELIAPLMATRTRGCLNESTAGFPQSSFATGSSLH